MEIIKLNTTNTTNDNTTITVDYLLSQLKRYDKAGTRITEAHIFNKDNRIKLDKITLNRLYDLKSYVDPSEKNKMSICFNPKTKEFYKSDRIALAIMKTNFECDKEFCINDATIELAYKLNCDVYCDDLWNHIEIDNKVFKIEQTGMNVQAKTFESLKKVYEIDNINYNDGIKAKSSKDFKGMIIKTDQNDYVVIEKKNELKTKTNELKQQFTESRIAGFDYDRAKNMIKKGNFVFTKTVQETLSRKRTVLTSCDEKNLIKAFLLEIIV